MTFYEELVEEKGLDEINSLEGEVSKHEVNYPIEAVPMETVPRSKVYCEMAKISYFNGLRPFVKFSSSLFMLPTAIRRDLDDPKIGDDTMSGYCAGAWISAVISTVSSFVTGICYLFGVIESDPLLISSSPLMTGLASGMYETARYVKKEARSRLEGKLNSRKQDE